MILRAAGELGVAGREESLHVAQALRHDHVPARKVGLTRSWIERAGDDAAMGGRLEDFWRRGPIVLWFKTLCDFAQAVERDFEDI